MSAQTVSDSQTNKGLSPIQRVERLVVVVALVGLILTGIPQRYASQEWTHVLIVLGGGIESLRILHRFFALIFMAEMVYHVLAVGYRWFVMGLRPPMLPGLGDFGALIGRVLTNLGLRRENAAPKVEFVLKLEYLVIVIAAIVLGLTGLALWNPIAVTNILPGEAIPIARSLHSDHAMLTVVILVLLRIGIVLLWHPRRAAVFAEQSTTATAERISARRRTYMPLAVVIAIVVVGAVVLFLNSEQTAITTVPRRVDVIYAPEVVPSEGDPHIGEVLWSTLRCSFCHGETANGGTEGQPALRNTDLTFQAFYEQVRIGQGDMPSFTAEELPDGYLVHLWAWLTQPQQ
ncbi:MAG: c-type cytochrome [Anaerolineae bacterium]